MDKDINVEKLRTQMRKGMLEFCVLLLIEKGDAYASEIIAGLKQARMIVVEGTLYPLLTRLKNDGLLSYRWEESSGGPPRKYYFITPAGEAFLGVLGKAWDELSASIDRLRRRTAPAGQYDHTPPAPDIIYCSESPSDYNPEAPTQS